MFNYYSIRVACQALNEGGSRDPLKNLKFPESLDKTVVPERPFLEKWGTHRGWAELVLS